MNEKAFMRRAQKLIAKAVQTKANLACSVRKYGSDSLNFEITHFDRRYGAGDSPYNNRSITVYNFNADTSFNKAEAFIDKLLLVGDALIENY